MLKEIREEIWNLYSGLKEYKKDPTLEKKIFLTKQFDKLFSKKVCSKTLSKILENTKKKKIFSFESFGLSYSSSA